MRRFGQTLTALFTTIFFIACSPAPVRPNMGEFKGSKGEDSREDSDQQIDIGENGSLNLECSEKDRYGVRAWRKLSNIEIKNTVEDVFGLTSGLDESEFGQDIQKQAGGYDNAMVSPNFINDSRLSGFIRYAASISEKVNMANLFPCLSTGKTCFLSTLPTLATKAWRRPPTTDEKTNMEALVNNLVAEKLANADIAKLLVQSLVLSRGFLYRSELGEKDSSGKYKLTDWEIASALSYLVQRRPPDAELQSLAQKGSLQDPKVLKAQAERLFSSPKSVPAWTDFGRMWLTSEQVLDQTRDNKDFTNTKQDLVDETNTFFTKILLGAEPSLETLMTADYSYGNASLKWLYGASPVNGKLTYPDDERRGILGQGSFLIARASEKEPSPIRRGVFVLNRLLCNEFINPPPTSLPAGTSNGEAKKSRSTNPSCMACHKAIDPVGFTFEKFDQLGLKRERDEKGVAIDTHDTLPIDGEDVSYDGPAELSRAIAGSTQGMECFSRQVFRFAMGRMELAPRIALGGKLPTVNSVNIKKDSCLIQSMASRMKEGHGNMRDAVLEMVSNPAFRIRVEAD